jgi:predicted nucleic acid-binding protein
LTHVYLDASALVKRFHQELGSEVVNDIIERVAADNPHRLVVSSLTTLETLAILNRRRNEAQIPLPEFLRALQGVLRDIRRFSHYLAIDDRRILTSAVYALKHNINSADAVHVALLLSLRDALRSSEDAPVCLAADKRLVRAVRAEGVTVIDPEQDSLTRAQALIP